MRIVGSRPSHSTTRVSRNRPGEASTPVASPTRPTAASAGTITALAAITEPTRKERGESPATTSWRRKPFRWSSWIWVPAVTAAPSPP